MKRTQAFTGVLIASLLLISCKKDESTVINNYGASETTAPKRKMMTEFGVSDSSFVLAFSFLNNEIGKLNELTGYSAGVANSKITILYNGSKPQGYQSFSLPANTLVQQGTYVLDGKGRIIQVVQRLPNADTVGISYITYTGVDYQPSSFKYYNKADDRVNYHSYFTYDSKGNMTHAVNYTNNGTLYKSSEIDVSGYSEGINPLNQIYYYLVTAAANGGFSSAAPLYFSNYISSSTREQRFDVNGNPDGVTLSDYNYETDKDNYVTHIISESQDILIKY